jgi:uncharacterized protein (TIGR03437 family)
MKAWGFALASALALAPLFFGAEAGRRRAPILNIDGVVSAAGFVPAPENFVAANSIISIFGSDLALQTREVRSSDLVRGRLPLALGGVQVRIGGILAPLYFVSPSQINAQVPSELPAGDWNLSVSRENLASENEAIVRVRRAAPGLFPVVAHSDYTIAGRGPDLAPARPGETILLFGTGFGPTIPTVLAGELPDFAAKITLPGRVRLADQWLPPRAIRYAGQAPGLAGVYQVNLELPADLAPGDHWLFLEIDGILGPAGVTVSVEP